MMYESVDFDDPETLIEVIANPHLHKETQQASAPSTSQFIASPPKKRKYFQTSLPLNKETQQASAPSTSHVVASPPKNRKTFKTLLPFNKETQQASAPSTSHDVASLLSSLLEQQTKILANQDAMKADLKSIDNRLALLEAKNKDIIYQRSESMAQNTMLRECKVLIKRMHRSICHITGEVEDANAIEIASTLPISSISACIEVEEKMQKLEYEMAMKAHMFKLKGSAASVDDVLRSLFTDSFCFAYNFDGKYGKLSLMETHLVNKTLFDVFQHEGRQHFNKEVKRFVDLSHNRHRQRQHYGAQKQKETNLDIKPLLKSSNAHEISGQSTTLTQQQLRQATNPLANFANNISVKITSTKSTKQQQQQHTQSQQPQPILINSSTPVILASPSQTIRKKQLSSISNSTSTTPTTQTIKSMPLSQLKTAATSGPVIISQHTQSQQPRPIFINSSTPVILASPSQTIRKKQLSSISNSTSTTPTTQTIKSMPLSQLKTAATSGPVIISQTIIQPAKSAASNNASTQLQPSTVTPAPNRTSDWIQLMQ